MDLENKQQNNQQTASQDTVSFTPLGGIGDVTRNMYLYEYHNEILIVDCGLGFADETMLGVDLLLPDISSLLKTQKKIVGMVLTHGHEDHIGALPFVISQLPQFPIYATPLTAALANEKMQEFGITNRAQSVAFSRDDLQIGSFTVSFIHITHSVPDSSNIFIKTPAGNFYHGSDFKFDLTPANGVRTDFAKIAKAADDGILCLMSDCLGSERSGFTPSEESLGANFEKAMRECSGKFIITTYSSNISRLNQAISAAEKLQRKVCFVGRSLSKTKQVGQRLGYLHMRNNTEIQVDEIKNYHDNQLVLLVAGSQGQENSAMSRIANGDHREIKINVGDMIVFSSDPIPGNEVTVYSLIDTIAKKGARVMYSDISNGFHVSGHGSSGDHMLLISLTRPKHLLPISGTYRHMVAYQQLAEKMRYKKNMIHLLENGQEIIFSKSGMQFGKKLDIKNVYVDQISGEEVENFVLRDREKLAKEGIVIIMVEIQAENGQLADTPEIVGRGFSPKDNQLIGKLLNKEIRATLSNKKGRITNWVHTRKQIEELATRQIFKKLHRRPLVLPVVIEV